MAKDASSRSQISTSVYEAELLRLQAELVKAQEWVKVEKRRVVVIFEGSDAVGKGGTIKRINEYLSPRSDEYRRFLHQCPIFERLLIEDGIMLRKYWFSVSDSDQQRHFKSWLNDPMRQWKRSPMDLGSILPDHAATFDSGRSWQAEPARTSALRGMTSSPVGRIPPPELKPISGSAGGCRLPTHHSFSD
jgi:polyphosphate kinase 2 (PPK2 family)